LILILLMLHSRTAWLVLFSLLAGGCSHYRKGTGTTWDHPQSLWVEPVIMETVSDDVAVALNRELRQAASRLPGWRIAASAEQARHRLEVRVTSQSRETLARRPDDSDLAAVMEWTLQAHYRLHDTASTHVEEGVCERSTPLPPDATFAESRRRQSPALLQELAQDLTQLALAHW
jgi:hypothetical protein